MAWDILGASIGWDEFFFIFFAVVTVAGAILVLYSKEIVRSVMWVSLAFMGVAFTYIFLGAEFLALIQILIYVGAVSVLMLFGIMLTKRKLLGGDRNE